MAIDNERFTGAGIIPPEEALALHEEVGAILGWAISRPDQGVMLPGVADSLLEEIDSSFKTGALKVKVGRKIVTLVIGSQHREKVTIKYRRRDASRANLIDNKLLSDDEVAFARSYFDTKVARMTGRGMYASADPDTLEAREKRIGRGLERIGRVDIVRAMSSEAFSSLPGIGRK